MTPAGGGAIERALWPAIHGADYPPEPMADCVYNVLFQMGIMATLEAEYAGAEHRFRDLDEAVAEFRGRLNCPAGREEQLRDSLGRLIPRDTDGTYRLDRSAWNATIRWDARHQPVDDKRYAGP